MTKGAEVRTDFFDTYEKDDKVWIAVPRERLGKDFLMEMKLARASARTGSMAGRLNLFEANVMTLERRGDQVFAVAEAVALHRRARSMGDRTSCRTCVAR